MLNLSKRKVIKKVRAFNVEKMMKTMDKLRQLKISGKIAQAIYDLFFFVKEAIYDLP